MSLQVNEQVDPTVLSAVILAFRRARFHLPEAWEAPFLIDFGDGSPQISTGEHVIEHEFLTASQYAVSCDDGQTGYEFTVSVDDIGQNEGSKVVRFCPDPRSVPQPPLGSFIAGPEVSSPPYIGRPGTLLDVVPVTDTTDPAWTSGFLTRDLCAGSIGSDVGECLEGAQTQKWGQIASEWDSWLPFTVWAFYSCSPAGVAEEEARAAAEGALTMRQSAAVEQEVIYGTLRGAPWGLKAQAAILGNYADVVAALAVASGEFHFLRGDSQGTILVSVTTGTLLAAAQAIQRVNGRWTAPCGCPVVLSAGMDSAALAAPLEVYHTGAMKVLAGPAFDLGMHVNEVNTRSYIVERTFGVAWLCTPVTATAPGIATSP